MGKLTKTAGGHIMAGIMCSFWQPAISPPIDNPCNFRKPNMANMRSGISKTVSTGWGILTEMCSLVLVPVVLVLILVAARNPPVAWKNLQEAIPPIDFNSSHTDLPERNSFDSGWINSEMSVLQLPQSECGVSDMASWTPVSYCFNNLLYQACLFGYFLYSIDFYL